MNGLIPMIYAFLFSISCSGFVNVRLDTYRRLCTFRDNSRNGFDLSNTSMPVHGFLWR